MKGADPSAVSQRSKQRQHAEMGTLGSGNHYLEVQKITEIYDSELARAFSLNIDEIIISIHCGSRGLGPQIGTEYLRDMALAAKEYGIELPDRELACAPIKSDLGQRYLGAMRAGINCALANRKGATRAFGPEHAHIPDKYRHSGQPVIIGGSMGTCSYLLAGTREGEALSYSSACHGAGRAMSRNQAKHKWRGSTLVRELGSRGILIRSPSMRGVAEEAPGAYKDVSRVVEVADRAGLARMVARVEPLICIKG
jgi:tRNA-splicing ligase RtcB